ncbi:MAG: iron ABC transporter permease [Pseudomonadota bacterium]
MSQATLILRSRGDAIALRLPADGCTMLALLVVGLVGVLAISVLSGSFDLTLGDVWQTLIATPPSETAETIVWEFRLPRTFAGILAGSLLALSGAALQTVTRNALADPSLVGVSQGASFAVVSLTLLLPASALELRAWFAFAGGLAVAAVILSLSRQRSDTSTIRFILIGIGIAAFLSACTEALLTYGDIDRAVAALGWLAGGVHAAGWGEVRMLAIWMVCLTPLLLLASRGMSALRMGAEIATGLGVRVRPLRTALIFMAVAMAAVATAAVGPLAFVGLVAPHVARRLSRAGVGLHLLLSASVGALLVSGADLLGRTIVAPVQIPAGLVTAVVGVPVFVWLLLRAKARSQL